MATNQAAMRRSLRACIVKPIPQKTLDAVLEFNMRVSAQVRGFLIQRELDFTDVLQRQLATFASCRSSEGAS